MGRLIRAEYLKLRTTQVGFWLLLTTAALGALSAVAAIAPSGDDGVHDAQHVPTVFSAFASTPAYTILFVLGVLGVTTEFRYQTITGTFLQTPSRWAVVTAKMITYALVGIVFALVALIFETIVGAPWLHARHLSLDLGHGSVQHAIIGTFGVLVLMTIIGLGVGALVRNQIVAVVVGIIFLVVLENLIVLIPVVKHVWAYTPNGAIQAILYTTGDKKVNGVTLLPTWGGVVVLVLWAFVPAVLGAAISMNRDIT